MSRTILIASNNPVILYVGQVHLERAGFTVETAQDGEQAYQRLQQEPSIVLLATSLLISSSPQKMHGFDLVEKVRKELGFDALPILLLLPLPNDIDMTLEEWRQERRPELLAAAADEFLYHPFHPAELVQTVQKLLSEVTPYRFGRYLLGELLWELSQSKIAVPGLTDTSPEKIEVLGDSGYDEVRLRSGSVSFDVRLSWRPDVLSVFLKTAYDATPSLPAIEVVEGDLLDQKVEVIVNAWNRNLIPWWLLLPQGVSGAIKRRGGTQPFREVARHGPIPLGQAVLTSAGRLPFRGIIHVAGIDILWRASETSIRQSVRSAMAIVEHEGFTSVAFPLIGAGSGNFSETKAQEIILKELKRIESRTRVVVVRYRR